MENEEYAIEAVEEGFLYDYSGLDEITATRLKRMVVDIRGRQRSAMHDMLAVGNQLLVAKMLLPFGSFEEWAHTEFELSLGSLNEFKNIALRFGKTPEILDSFTPTTARLLAGPSVPDEVIEAVVELGREVGRPLLVREVKQVKDELMGVLKSLDHRITVEAEGAYALDEGYYAVVLEGSVWQRIRQATRVRAMRDALTGDDADQLAMAISAGLTEEVEPLVTPMKFVPGEAVTFEKWLEAMPSSVDVADTLSFLRVAEIKLQALTRYDGLKVLATRSMEPLKALITTIARHAS